MIISLAIPALLSSVGNVVDGTARVEDKMYAYWIAQNKLQELMLTKELEGEIPKNKQNDTIEYAGQDWFWQIDVSSQETIVGEVFRFEIKVGHKENSWLATLSGFVGGGSKNTGAQGNPPQGSGT